MVGDRHIEAKTHNAMPVTSLSPCTIASLPTVDDIRWLAATMEAWQNWQDWHVAVGNANYYTGQHFQRYNSLEIQRATGSEIWNFLKRGIAERQAEVRRHQRQ